MHHARGSDPNKRAAPRWLLTRNSATRSSRGGGSRTHTSGVPATLTVSDTLRVPPLPSLAVCDLATVCAAQDRSVKAIDNYLTLPDNFALLEQCVREDPPRLIGISTTFLMNARHIVATVRKLRGWSPESKIVLGGPMLRKEPELQRGADYSVLGEGERPLREFLAALDRSHTPLAIADVVSHGRPLVRGKRGKPLRARTEESFPIAD